MADNPTDKIENGPMGAWQVAAVATTVGLNALDGFDVLSISYASPGIAKDWHIDKAALGAVLSMELIGMAIGSILLGRLADKIGRRPTIIACLVAMLIGMFMASTAHDVTTLSIWRVVTGLGIGGMLAAINAVAAELSSLKHRILCMSAMVIGYPLGSVIGGTIVSQLLKGGDWRIVFEIGAMATACFIPLVWFLVPETPAFLLQKRPDNALSRINAALVRFGHAASDAMPAPIALADKPSISALFKPALMVTTLLITLSYLTHIISFYFILKWIPKIVVDLGFAPPLAGGVLVWSSIGGVTGGLLFGFLSKRFGLQRTTVCALLLSVLALVNFGRGAHDLHTLSVAAFIAGFATNSAIVGMYSIAAKAFPTALRATGTGFVIGVGRGGSALAPWAAGLLFAAGYGLQIVAIIMAMGSLIAAIAIWKLRMNEAEI